MTDSREEDERVDERVMEILTAARRKPAAEREAYLRIACAGDEELLREVVDALSWEERMGGFLQQPVAVIADGNPDSAVRATVQFAAGQEIGQYRIESKLGEGGMSTVWLALDTGWAAGWRSSFSPAIWPMRRAGAVFSGRRR
jgi:hypothetical protein